VPSCSGLAIPLVVAVSTSLAGRRGFLIRNRNAFETARKVNVVIFDKTGTLTEGKFEVSEVVSFSQMKKEEVLTYCASCEAHSEHAIAKAIVSSAKNLFEVSDFKALPGIGAEGRINGRLVQVVSPSYVKERNIPHDQEKVEELLSRGKTVVFLIIDGVLKGAVTLSDRIRKESKEAISNLKKMGIKCVMLTGDTRKVAEEVAKELGIDEFYAEVLPREKRDIVEKIRREGHIVAMVGDGINDAPSLVQADVGIAIGAGVDLAIDSADIILVRNDPRDVVHVIKLAKRTYGKMVQNLIWATGYNALAIPLAGGALYSLGIVLIPAVGAILMSLSTVIVALNARLLKMD